MAGPKRTGRTATATISKVSVITLKMKMKMKRRWYLRRRSQKR